VSFSPQVDAALLVVDDNATTRNELAQAVDLLGTTNIVGTVLNRSGRVSP
jgi:Mrp family chromosome partitioning ATPase